MTLTTDASAATDTTDVPTLWWREPFRMFQTNLREIDVDLDVERVLDYIQDFGANAWLLSVGGIISGYPTDLDFQTRNPNLTRRPSGDLVGDALTAAHRRGVKLLGRMDFSKVDRKVAEEHPEWCFVDPEGNQQVYNGLTSVCPSGGYYQERVFEVLEEILERYDLDGFFFNWLTFGEVDYEKRYRGVCHCLACQAAFAAFAPGVDLPVDNTSPTYLVWKRWSTGVLDEWTARARAFIATRRPEAPLIMGSTSDIVFHEANNAVNRPLWHHLCTEHVSLARTGRPDVPVLVNCAAFVDMPYRLAGEEPHHYAQHLIQAIARGANPSIYIMGTPFTVDYECLEVGAELIRFHRDNQAVYRGYRSAAATALVRPDPLKREGAHAAAAVEEYRGIWSALLERHIPFEVLAEERIPEAAQNGELDRLSLLVLPDAGTLSDEAVASVDDWVERGGRLLATASSGFAGGDSQLASMPVVACTAVKDTRQATWSSHLVPDPDSDGHGAYPVPVVGAYHVVIPRGDAHRGWHVLSRAPYGPPEKCYGHLDLDQPGWVSGTYGDGKVTLIPWTVGRAYSMIGLSSYRDLVADLARDLLATDAQVTTDLPDQVEVILAESAQGTVVTLRNLSGAAVQKFLPPMPTQPARLQVRVERPVTHARALVAGRDLAFSARGALVTLDVPPVDTFEVILLTSA
jgi:hypothetical protein